MANRYTLHIMHLEEFKTFLEARGFYPLHLTNPYEVLRMRSGKQTVVIYKRANAQQHLTVQNRSVSLVREFFRERKCRKEVS